jgi:dipicolinate synthase subunit A
MGRLAGISVAVIGGDRREREICRLAAEAGGEIRAYGVPWPANGLPGVTRCDTLEQALADADLCLLPLPLPGADGTVYAPAAAGPIRLQAKDFARMGRNARIIAGSVNEKILVAAAEAAIPIDTYDADINGRRARAVAIAEAAARLVITATERTVNGAHAAVLGNGVLGQAVADIFKRLGAKAWQFGRSPSPNEVLPIARFSDQASSLDIVLSTIPAPVIGPDVFKMLPPHALVVDLASPAGIAPAAESAGAHTLHARGLGESAPVMVGGIQWRQILALLEIARQTTHVSSA